MCVPFYSALIAELGSVVEPVQGYAPRPFMGRKAGRVVLGRGGRIRRREVDVVLFAHFQPRGCGGVKSLKLDFAIGRVSEKLLVFCASQRSRAQAEPDSRGHTGVVPLPGYISPTFDQNSFHRPLDSMQRSVPIRSARLTRQRALLSLSLAPIVFFAAALDLATAEGLSGAQAVGVPHPSRLGLR